MRIRQAPLTENPVSRHNGAQQLLGAETYSIQIWRPIKESKLGVKSTLHADFNVLCWLLAENPFCL